MSPDPTIPAAGHTFQPRPRNVLSCLECSRRKIRCDKKVPCRACTERGEAKACKPRQLPSSKPRPSSHAQGNAGDHDMRVELADLRRRMIQVESLLGLDRDALTSSEENQDAMEEGALKIGANQRRLGSSLLIETNQPSEDSHDWYNSISLSACLASLPPRHQCQRLVVLYYGLLDPFCGCIHRPSFLRRHDNFWALLDQAETPDDMFLALLFAVLSVTAFFLEDDQAVSEGFDPQQLKLCARKWFDCCLATFFRCEGLTHPSLMACQTIMTLSYAFHLTGNTRMHVTLTALSISHARMMNLHLLGSRGQSTREDHLRQETGRRIWWQIVECDWSFLPYYRYTTISPHQFNTALPDLTDTGHYASSMTGPHNLSYLIACCKSSKVLYELLGTLKPSQIPTYGSVLLASDQIDEILAQIPADLQNGNAPTDIVSPINISYTKRFLGMILAYRQYLVHRAYFIKSLSDATFERSHRACVHAAKTILFLSDQGLPKTFYRLWNTTLWLVAAGIVLALDLVQGSGGKVGFEDSTSLRGQLSKLIRLLTNLADKSGIGSRGATLISHLCATERDISTGVSSRMPFTRNNIIELFRVGVEHDGPSAVAKATGPMDVDGTHSDAFDDDSGRYSGDLNGMAETDGVFSSANMTTGIDDGTIDASGLVWDDNQFLEFFGDLIPS